MTVHHNKDDRYRTLGADEIEAANKPAANDNWELAGPCPDGTPPPEFKLKQFGYRNADEYFAFHDADGRVVFYEMHWRPKDGKKEVRPAAWCKNQRTRKCEWRMRGLAAPRPLFNLHLLAECSDKPVMIFEGCRKAHKAATLFPDHICTALPFGAKGSKGCDLTPLHGRNLAIWPDADEPGEAFAYDIAFSLKHRAEVRAVDAAAVYRGCVSGDELPPQGWDVVDALEFGIAQDEIARAALDSLCELDTDIERPDGRSFIKVGGATLTPSRGLVMLVWKGSGKNRVQEEVWVSEPFEVLGQSRDKTGLGWGVSISWKDNDGREHTECVPKAEIFGDARKLAAKLAAAGFPLNLGCERLFAQFLTMVKPRSRVTEVMNTGWHDIGEHRVFVLPDRTFGRVPNEIVRIKADRNVSNYAQAGTVEDWRAGVGTLVKGQRLGVLAVSTALSGPLLRLTNTDGGGLHIHGESSGGKTTLLRAAASVWGRGDSQGYIISWHSTANGLEARAALASDTMLALDEVGSADSDELWEAIYQISNGAGKSRAMRSGDAQTNKHWRVTAFSSGELPIETKLAHGMKNKSVMAGQLSRMVDIPADTGCGLGVFDSCGSAESPSALSRAIASAAATNYGTAGPALLDRIVAVGPDRVAEIVRRDFIRPMIEALGPASGQVIRVAQRFAVVAAAGELATRWGISPWDEGEARRSLEWALNRWIEGRGGPSVAAEERQAIERVRRFLQTHGESRFEPLDSGVRFLEDEPIRLVINRAGWREGYGADRVWYLLRETWREVCGDLDPRRVAEALDRAGVLVHQGGAGLTIVKKIRGNPLRVYALKSAALGETVEIEEAVAA